MAGTETVGRFGSCHPAALKSATSAFNRADQADQAAALNLALLQAARATGDANRQAADQLAADLQARIDQDNAELAQRQEDAVQLQALLAVAQADFDANAMVLNQT